MQAAMDQLNTTHGPDAISDLQTSLATLSQQLAEQRDRLAQLANITDELDALVNESTASLVDETGVLAALREQNNSNVPVPRFEPGTSGRGVHRSTD